MNLLIERVVQEAHDLLHIVPVERPEIADVHALEDVLLMAQGRLDGVVEPYDALAALVVQMAFGVQPSRGLEPQAVVGGVGVEVQEILLHASHGPVDAHVVVVEDDEQVVVAVGDIVQALEGKASAHGSVADDGHDMPLFMPCLLGGHGHAEGCRDGVRRVSAGEGVVFAFCGRGKRAHAVQPAVGAELVSASRQYLVAVGLMPHIPHQPVVGRVEDIVQCHRNLHHAEARREVSGIDGNLVDDVLTKLPAHLRQVVDAQFP